jgi:DNA helicase II / ATP-dependent DNA helicase PcrA
MSFIPSPQQKAIFSWIQSDRGNAFVQAVAGAGKTTTLIEGARLATGSIAFLAFNKKIVDEISNKLVGVGSDAKAGTFHSFGFQAWRKVAPYVKVSKGQEKNWKIYETLQIPEGYQSFVGKAIGFAKQRALGVFGSIKDRHEWVSIVDRFDLNEELDDNHKLDEAIDFSIKALEESNKLCRTIIDFDDMIYAPVFFGASLWQYDWVFVDEAQDTNPARRALARKLVKTGGRIIFVGDRAQAIYGFTGADSDAVDQIIKEFACKELPLTVTYRCPKAIVKEAQAYVSHIQAHDSAPEGEVVSLDKREQLDCTKLEQTDAILCRKTAPLVELAFRLIRKGIACHVEGRDIGAGLAALLFKWKKIKTTDKYLEKLEAWYTKQLELLKAKGKDYQAEALTDRVDTVKALCEGCDTVAEVKAKIDKMFADSDDEGKRNNNLTLSTVHKAKGREWNTVYVYGFKKWMPSKMAKQDWQLEQERNLIYVAMTRAKKKLLLVE